MSSARVLHAAEEIVIDGHNTRSASPGVPVGSRTVQPGSRIEQRSSDGNIPQRRRAAAQENEVEVIDLTSSSPELEIVSSTVVPAPKEVKRPRLSPGKQQLVAHAVQQQLAAAQAPPPPTAPESPKGPKCGICLELMGGNSSKQMWAPSCGHVYCKDCLLEAVKMTRKCPTCRKGVQVRQLHPVFLNF